MNRTVIVTLAIVFALCSTGPAFENADQAWKEAYKLYGARKYKEAIPVLEKAAELAKTPDKKAYYRLYAGFSLYNTKQYDKAAPVFQEVIDAEKGHPSHKSLAWRHLGYMLQRKGKNDEALVAFQKAAELARDDKNKARGLIGEAELLIRLKQYDKAIAALQKTVDLPKVRTYHKSIALRYIGDVYARQKQDEKACECYARAAEVKKAPPYYTGQALLRLGAARARMKQYDKAREAYQKALALEKVSASIKKKAEQRLKKLEKAK